MWFNRIQTRQGKSRQQGSAILHMARFLLNEFHTANFKITQPVYCENMQWVPPRAPWYKINVDGVVCISLRSSSMGGSDMRP